MYRRVNNEMVAKTISNDRDLPLKMYINGNYHATFDDILVLDFIKTEFESAGYKVDLKGVNDD